jgi:hypothetical protein
MLTQVATNLLLGVHLVGIKKRPIVPDRATVDRLLPHWFDEHKALQNIASAETPAISETIENHLERHVQELIRQLMWAFNWADDALGKKVKQILVKTGLLKSHKGHDECH